MPYMRADTSAKVGFRPYHRTDAFGAAHLSGMGEYHPGHPFDPWELNSGVHAGMHGLGQHPFKPQAWHLHGLGDGPQIYDPSSYVDVMPPGADPTAQAVDELEASGHITHGEGDAILNGSMSFQDVLGFDPTDQQSFFGLTDVLRETHQILVDQEQKFQAAAQARVGSGVNSPEMADFGRTLTAMQAEYTQLSSHYIQLYTAVAGSAPSGLSGLGVIPAIWWVAVGLAGIVAAIIAIYALHTHSKALDVDAVIAQTAAAHQASTASTNQTLLQRLAVAQAAGDTVTAQTIAKTLAVTGAQAPQPGTDFSAWFQKNAMWIGVSLAGIVLLPNLTSGLGGVLSSARGGKRQTTKVTRETY